MSCTSNDVVPTMQVIRHQVTKMDMEMLEGSNDRVLSRMKKLQIKDKLKKVRT